MGHAFPSTSRFNPEHWFLVLKLSKQLDFDHIPFSSLFRSEKTPPPLVEEVEKTPPPPALVFGAKSWKSSNIFEGFSHSSILWVKITAQQSYVGSSLSKSVFCGRIPII